MVTASRAQMLRIAQVPAHHVDEGGIALGGPHRRQMADQPDSDADDPEAQAQPDGGGERAVDDRDRARRAAEQDRFGERAMDGRIEAGDGLVRSPSDQRSTAEREERQEEARCGKGDRQAEDDLDQPAEAAGGLAEGERQAGDDDDDHRDDLGDGALNRFQDLLSGCSQGMFEPAA